MHAESNACMLITQKYSKKSMKMLPSCVVFDRMLLFFSIILLERCVGKEIIHLKILYCLDKFNKKFWLLVILCYAFQCRAILKSEYFMTI